MQYVELCVRVHIYVINLVTESVAESKPLGDGRTDSVL